MEGIFKKSQSRLRDFKILAKGKLFDWVVTRFFRDKEAFEVF